MILSILQKFHDLFFLNFGLILICSSVTLLMSFYSMHWPLDLVISYFLFLQDLLFCFPHFTYLYILFRFPRFNLSIIKLVSFLILVEILSELRLLYCQNSSGEETLNNFHCTCDSFMFRLWATLWKGFLSFLCLTAHFPFGIPFLNMSVSYFFTIYFE